jgi:hypothetical protein
VFSLDEWVRVVISLKAGYRATLLPVRAAARRADRESQGSLDSNTGWLVTAEATAWGVLPCDDDAAHDHNAQMAAVRPIHGERVTST